RYWQTHLLDPGRVRSPMKMALGYIRTQREPLAADHPSEELALIQGFCQQRGLFVAEVFTDAADTASVPLLERPGGKQLATVLDAGSHIVTDRLQSVFVSIPDFLALMQGFRSRNIALHLARMSGPVGYETVPLSIEGALADFVIRALTVARQLDSVARSEAIR